MKKIIYCILSIGLIVGGLCPVRTVFAQSSSLPGQPKSRFSLHSSPTRQKPLKKAPPDKAQSASGVRHGHVLDLSSVVPDPSFGNYGSVRSSISGGILEDEAYSVAIQTDGKIVAAGVSMNGPLLNEVALAQYNTDGSSDNTFGTNGSTRNYFSGGNSTDDRAYSVAIQSDGKIIVAGQSLGGSGYAFALARYQTDGRLDSAFGTDGTARNTISGGGDDVAYSAAIQSDGRIVVVGCSGDASSNGAFAIARYKMDGSLDSSFGTNGSTRNFISGGSGNGDVAYSVAIQGDGKIVVAGSSNLGNPEHLAFALARYDTNGSLDSTFGVNGTMRNYISGGNGTDDEAHSVAIQSDGKIVVAGYSEDASGHYAFALAWYKVDGSLDSTFGTNGSTRNNISGGNSSDDRAYSLAIQSDGKIVAAGDSWNGSTHYAFALARYKTDGSLDSTFGVNGTARNTINGGNGTDDEAHSVAIQTDGKIVAAGLSGGASGYAFAVARYVVNPVDISLSGATFIGMTGATLNGTVNGFSMSTTVQFLYGTSSGAYTDSMDATPGTVSTDADVPVSAALTGLSPEHTYYYTISTTSSAGYYTGTEMSFTTSYATAGKALKFNGSNDYVSVPNTVLSTLSDHITIEAWIKPVSVGASERIVDDIQPGGSNGFLLDLVGGTPRLLIGSNSVSPENGLPAANAWYHIAGTYDGIEMRIYVNGVLEGSLSAPGSIPTNSYNLLIGTEQDSSGNFFDGVIDEVRLWNTTLDSDQIREDMHRTLSGTESGLIAYWQFNEGTSVTAHDLTANRYDGTLANFTFDGTTNGWVTSTAPVGDGTSAEVPAFTSGTAPLGTVFLITTDDFDNAVDLVATQIAAPPNSLPSGSAVTLGDRYWIITPYAADPGTFSANLTFTVPTWFTAAGPGTYTLYHRDDNADGAWSPCITGAGGVTSNTITFGGITSFSQFIIGSSDVSLGVQATDFAVKSDIGSVTLTWQTRSEVNNAGFNILRQDAGPSSGSTSLTTGFKLIASYTSNDGLKGMGTSSSGRAYSFTDSKVVSGKTYQYKIQSVSTSGTTIDLITLCVTVDVPKIYALYQNYPNPFNPSTTIRFDLKQQSTVTLEIYNTLGQRVEEWNYGMMDAGRYNENIGMAQFASGVYFYRISAVGSDGQRFVSMKKLLLMK